MGILVNGLNALAIIIGALIGILLRHKVKKIDDAQLLKIMGLVVILIGISGALSSLNNQEVSQNEILIVGILALALGGVLGSLCQVEIRINKACQYLNTRFTKTDLSKGFIEATFVFCVGAMAIIGGLQSGMGNHSTLIIKSIIDGITALVLASSLGASVMLSAIVTFLYQAVFVLLGYLGTNLDEKGPFLTTLNLVGYIIIMGIGYNFISGKDDRKIPIANLIFSIVLVCLYYGIMYLFSI